MYRLRILGGAALDRDGATQDSFGSQRKTLALLALVAVARTQGISRERLAAFLWPESDADRSRGALNQALYAMRRRLDAPDLFLGGAQLRLNPSCIDSDVDAFLAALESRDLVQAAGLYAGPLMDGFHLTGAPEFEQWLDAERNVLARRHAAALEQLAVDAEARGDHATAVGWWRRLQADDPLSGRITLRLMRALSDAGEQAAALRCARGHEALLRDELGTAPDAEVAALAARLLDHPAESQVDPEPSLPAPATASLPGTGAPDPLDMAPASRSRQTARPVAASAVPAPRQDRSRPLRVAAATGAVLIVIALGLLLQRVWRGLPVDAPVGAYIAVMPFANAGGDRASDHVPDGLTDELIAGLSAVDGLSVAPRAAVARLRRRGLHPQAIADSLGVAAVVHGNLTRTGDVLHINARMVSARDSAVVWAATYERDLRDLMAVQQEMTRAIVEALRLPATAAPGTAVAGRLTSDAEAYELYLRGRHSWRMRTRDALLQAVVYYEEAVERDPAFAAAYAGLADTYVNLSNFGYRDPEEALARAEVAADRALALDPGLAEAHASKGFALASRLDFREAEASFHRAMALKPAYTWAHHYYTLLLLMLGRTEDALEHNRHALSTDPLSVPANATRGIILCQQGDLAGARRELERARSLSPDVPLVAYYLGVVRASGGDHDEAILLLEQAAGQAPDFPGVQGALAWVYRRTNRQRAADSILAGLESEARTGGPRPRVNLAFAYAALGRTDAAFTLLQDVRWDVPSLIELRADPLLAPLRSDRRYTALLHSLGADP
jgi:DNA-binding SARP family transcriptional activator/TolB-like protein/Flp pilus assembly protein TadD